MTILGGQWNGNAEAYKHVESSFAGAVARLVCAARIFNAPQSAGHIHYDGLFGFLQMWHEVLRNDHRGDGVRDQGVDKVGLLQS